MTIWTDGTNYYDDDNGAALTLASWPTGLTTYTGAYPPPLPTSQQWALYQSEALNQLAKTDETMERIQEGVSLGLTTWTTVDVVAWVTYRQALRAILSQVQPGTIPSALPTQPAYPVGT